jgi:Beta-L-arabinofuranosidase, GH127
MISSPRFLLFLATGFIVAWSFVVSVEAQDSVTVVEKPDASGTNPYYSGNRPPLKPSPFIKLPAGAIEPEGWLKEILVRQKDGLCGHLMEISTFLDKENNGWLDSEGEGASNFEEVPYWLKGYANLGYVLHDKTIIDESAKWIKAVMASQREDGFFGPWIEMKGKPELFGNMLMLWVLQSYYEYSGDKSVLEFMTKYFAWQNGLPEDTLFKTGKSWEGTRAGDNLYSVYWLYNITGERWLLDLAAKIHRNTWNWKQADNLPSWHNVNFSQGFREPAQWWMQSGDESDLKATYNNLDVMYREVGQVPGGMFGGDENVRKGYGDPRQGIEACGIVERMASDEILLRITGDPFWADHCEDVAFNTWPAAMMPDMKSMRYFTAPNMVRSDADKHKGSIERKSPGHLLMNPFNHRCCQHNHGQGWPYFTENLWQATPDSGLAAVLYSASKVTARVGSGAEVSIAEETHYPFENQITFRISSSSPKVFPLYLRIPSWCDNPTVSINNKPADLILGGGRYIRIERTWSSNDTVVLNFPEKLAVKQWDKNQNSLSVSYGPLTYSLKIEENMKELEVDQADPAKTFERDINLQKSLDISKWPSWLIDPGTPWNYGLSVNRENPEQSLRVLKKDWPSDNYPFAIEAAPIEIKAKGRRIPSWTLDDTGMCSTLPTYPAKASPTLEDITLIPMGAARLRISSFPPVD